MPAELTRGETTITPIIVNVGTATHDLGFDVLADFECERGTIERVKEIFGGSLTTGESVAQQIEFNVGSEVYGNCSMAVGVVQSDANPGNNSVSRNFKIFLDLIASPYLNITPNPSTVGDDVNVEAVVFTRGRGFSIGQSFKNKFTLDNASIKKSLDVETTFDQSWSDAEPLDGDVRHLPAGEYEITFDVDSTNTVLEEDDRNNFRQFGPVHRLIVRPPLTGNGVDLLPKRRIVALEAKGVGSNFRLSTAYLEIGIRNHPQATQAVPQGTAMQVQVSVFDLSGRNIGLLCDAPITFQHDLPPNGLTLFGIQSHCAPLTLPRGEYVAEIHVDAQT